MAANKKELLSKLNITKLDNNTVFINNSHFNFSYTKADSVVLSEHVGKYRYF